MQFRDLNAFLQTPEMTRLVDMLRGMGVQLPLVMDNIQRDGSLPFMRWLVKETTSGMEARLAVEDPPGIVLSTHRDIVCDPALYNLSRVEAGRPTTHIVLGTNLANKPWVKELMARNKALFIDRSLTGRAALLQQKQLSEDIAEIIANGGHVWIAQAPGRAKSGVDATHSALLRMLGLSMGGESHGAAALSGLVRPLAIRYDVNPCDARLVKEKLTGDKAPDDDEWSMREGLLGWKGGVHLAEGEPVDLSSLDGKESWPQAATRMDQAMAQLHARGQWADAALQTLGSDRHPIERADFHARWEVCRRQLEAWRMDFDPVQGRRLFAEVYREVQRDALD